MGHALGDGGNETKMDKMWEKVQQITRNHQKRKLKRNFHNYFKTTDSWRKKKKTLLDVVLRRFLLHLKFRESSRLRCVKRSKWTSFFQRHKVGKVSQGALSF